MVSYPPRTNGVGKHQQQYQQKQQGYDQKPRFQQKRPDRPETSNTDDPASLATTFIGRHGWGTQGRMLGISRMFQTTDVTLLKTQTFLCSKRPRGVLSGFLAIVPTLGHAVYLPPIGGKIPARSIRMRLSEDLLRDGAVLSVYWDATATALVLEDVLVWKGQPVWQTQSFQDRWMTCMQTLAKQWQPDDVLQGCTIRFAEYGALEQIEKPDPQDAREVLEFVPVAPNMKRMIWLPNAEQEEADHQILVAHREVAIGPDVFSLWRPSGSDVREDALEVSERLGIAYIRSLAMSRALRLHAGDVFRVKTTWHKGFERHEIVGIA